VPEPVLIAIAAALAGKAAGNLYDMVKKKFATRREAAAALEAAAGAAPNSPEVQHLAQELANAEATDPDFATALRATWQTISADNGAIVNNLSGTVSGNAVLARDIEGGITF
jgi:hypothetical protein